MRTSTVTEKHSVSTESNIIDVQYTNRTKEHVAVLLIWKRCGYNYLHLPNLISVTS